MAIYDSRTMASDRLFGVHLGSAITSVIGRMAAWNDARVTRNSLSRLTDRELDDIGLCRGDIDSFR